MTILDSIILGVIEGLTEFLPISSTGHLILVSHFLGLEQTNAHKTFEVSIQLGSILAVLFLFKQKLLVNKTLWIKIIAAFLPTALFGFLFYKTIKSLFGIETVAIMLIVGGIAFLIIEYFRRDHNDSNDKSVDDLSIKESIMIGLFQTLSMVPGTSRSGATMIGGLFARLSRKSAAEFSFLLAIPTMFAATAYDLFKNRNDLVVDDYSLLIIGFITAFLVAFATVKAMMKFLTTHTFISFGIYRIVVGVLFLTVFGQ
ncbi:MAG: undecaprenyl-diphosphate phosphatase [Sulfurimonas sp.]|uniref:undecaprenyl-diphosphate phosphatase n=1 Tax=Sulfurimonas sp. TaxID=2022749 RepID=UPI002625B8FA|nr:undecaprenyl-diphosphate phosphatase [Sulfurimonas sp.]MDD5372919.1 undecaprenyl-diphosphate phosphatase [Sulfurimonas sp.]